MFSALFTYFKCQKRWIPLSLLLASLKETLRVRSFFMAALAQLVKEEADTQGLCRQFIYMDDRSFSAPDSVSLKASRP